MTATGNEAAASGEGARVHRLGDELSMQNSIFAVMAALVVLTGCRPPDPKEVAARTSKDVQNLVREAWETGAQTNNWRSVDDFFVQSGASTSTSSRPRIPAASQLDSGLDSVSEVLARVFTEGNVVDTAGGAVTFQVRGLDVCSNSPDCISQVDRMDIRVKAWGDMDMALLVGPQRFEVSVLRIRAGKSIAWEVDLAQAQQASAFLTQVLNTNTGFQLPYATLTASGKYELKLEKNAAMDFTLSQSILTPLTWAMTASDGVTRTASLEARSPAYSVRVEGAARKLTALVNLGQTSYRGLWKDFGNSGASGPIEILLAGLSGTLVFEDGKNEQRLENVGIGDGQSVVRYSGRDVLTVDFNKNDGRRVNITASPTARGVSLSASPGLQVEVFTGFGALDAELGADAYQNELKNSRYEGSFTASSGQTPAVEILAPRGQTSGALQLSRGVLRLSVNDPRVAPRSFSAPMCLGTGGSTGNNSIVEGLSAVSCP